MSLPARPDHGLKAGPPTEIVVIIGSTLASKMKGQAERFLVGCMHDGLEINMWVNRATKTIESA